MSELVGRRNARLPIHQLGNKEAHYRKTVIPGVTEQAGGGESPREDEAERLEGKDGTQEKGWSLFLCGWPQCQAWDWALYMHTLAK